MVWPRDIVSSLGGFLFLVFLVSTASVNGQKVAMMQIRTRFSLTALWLEEDPCEWRGVRCDLSGLVSEIVLSEAQLVGQLPLELFTLSGLKWLDWSFNPGLTGSIPDALGNLTNLEVLNLEACNLTGPIPDSINRLAALQQIILNRNNLVGPLPAQLSGMRNLTWFDISENKINGKIPDSIGLLPSLQHIHFFNNSLEGQIPRSISNISSLVHLVLDWNQFTGDLPLLTNLTNPGLRMINMNQNSFSQSKIPKEYFQLPQLVQLKLSNCSLSDDISTVTGDMKSITLLDLSYNPDLEGGFPTQTAVKLSALFLNGNTRAVIGKDWSAVEENFPFLPNLQELHMAGCGLSGNIAEIPKLQFNLVELSNNNLQGRPLNIIGTTRVFLEGNPAICGPNANVLVDAERAACTPEGTVPGVTLTERCSQRNCNPTHAPNWALILSNKVTDCPCARPLVVVIRLDNPPFAPIEFESQNRPAMLSEQLARIVGLDSSQVYVPPSNFTAGVDLWVWTWWFPNTTVDSLGNPVESLDDATVDRILKVLPASGGRLNGSLGIFIVASRTLPQNFNIGVVHNVTKPLSAGVIAAILLSISVLVIAIIGVAIYALRQRKRAEAAELSKNVIVLTGVNYGGTAYTATSDGPRLQGARLFTLQEMQELTNDFSDDHVIGVGGYGSVYKGTLEDGTQVAIKRLDPNSHQGAQEFNSEVELLSRVHHRNLVNLIGFCNQDREQALIYELMANGMVKDWLIGRRSPPLTFPRRLEIALGSARGLQYLHQDCSPAIIHRDIKTANILLSDNFTAKVADFGLSKNVVAGEEESFVKGTLGYLDPEYFRTQQLTEKSDVYSFGVVLLELMTGMGAVSKVTKNHISRDVKLGLAKDGAAAVADPALKGDYDENALMRVIALGLRCLQEGEEFAFRPSMPAVVKELDSICQSAGVTEDDAITEDGGTSSVASLFSRSGSLFRRSQKAWTDTTKFSRSKSMTGMTGGPGSADSEIKTGEATSNVTITEQMPSSSSSTAFYKAQQREEHEPIVPPQAVEHSQSFAMTQRIASWWRPNP